MSHDPLFRLTPAAMRAASEGDAPNFFAAALPGGIEAQEAAGQRDLCASSRLPKDAPWPELEALGIVRGEDVDNLFVNATLPAGWSIKPTDHSMWSKLLDETGAERASIFYKAAFYDRSAHLTLTAKRS